MLKTILKLLLSLITSIYYAFLLQLLCITTAASAYPDMIRKSYASCQVCHYSPSGGQRLNDYGQMIAWEELPTFQYEKKTKFPVGIDTRHLRYGKREFPMAYQIDAAYMWENGVTLAATRSKEDWGTTYGMFSKNSFNIRAGKFFPNYGIMIADHTRSYRRGQIETLNSEISYVSKYGELFFTSIHGETDKGRLNYKYSFTARTGYAGKAVVNLWKNVRLSYSEMFLIQGLRETRLRTPSIEAGYENIYFLAQEKSVESGIEVPNRFLIYLIYDVDRYYYGLRQFLLPGFEWQIEKRNRDWLYQVHLFF